MRYLAVAILGVLAIIIVLLMADWWNRYYPGYSTTSEYVTSYPYPSYYSYGPSGTYTPSSYSYSYQYPMPSSYSYSSYSYPAPAQSSSGGGSSASIMPRLNTITY